MNSNVCNICGANMLHYENPDREKCPREVDHYKYTPRSRRESKATERDKLPSKNGRKKGNK